MRQEPSGWVSGVPLWTDKRLVIVNHKPSILGEAIFSCDQFHGGDCKSQWMENLYSSYHLWGIYFATQLSYVLSHDYIYMIIYIYIYNYIYIIKRMHHLVRKSVFYPSRTGGELATGSLTTIWDSTADSMLSMWRAMSISTLYPDPQLTPKVIKRGNGTPPKNG